MMTPAENTCIYCGAMIPEGRMVCPNCERKQTKGGKENE